MELKKNPRVDLKRWSSTLTNLGLVVSIALVLVAFEWKAYEDFKIKDFSGNSEIWDIPDVPITIQTPPPPPIIPIDIIIKPDNEEINKKTEMIIDIDFEEQKPVIDVILEGPPTLEVPDEINDFVEVQASFKGGMDAWYAYLKKNLIYPSQARRMGIEGSVIVRFVVNTDGTIEDVEVLRSIGGGCDEIAMKVIANSPAWNPGIIKDRPVRSRMTMPIRFRLD
ncbi:MAG: energy transducer TonB [Algoriphagus sp.]|uniref:energy transducer TonB n=1 Tax=Algoriphagus sp. TaxID=1872435 RepID=UPI00263856B3|nr:energy transducer TonB [Algoriphagus sp.]MDG1276490.1 energy transducer TonB [Algoriphagus sp.]